MTAPDWDRHEASLAATLAAIAAAQAQAGDADAAARTAHLISRDVARAHALIEVAAARARAGEHALAQAHFADVLEAALDGDADYGPNTSLLEALAAEQVRCGYPDALSTLQHITPGRKRAEAQVRTGFVEEALASAQGLEDEREREAILRAAVGSHVQHGRWADARSVAGRVRKGPVRDDAFLALAAGLASARSWEQAGNAARQIGDAAQRGRALLAVALAQAGAGFGEAAVSTAEAIAHDRDACLNQVAEALAAAGDKEAVKKLLPSLARSPDAACNACGVLARLYPDRAGAIAAQIRDMADLHPVSPRPAEAPPNRPSAWAMCVRIWDRLRRWLPPLYPGTSSR